MALVGTVGLSGFAFANQTSNTKSTNTQLLTTNSNKLSEAVFEIEGFDVKLNQKDKALAKSFLLTDREFARYKYIMEYTPRGYWTPDIDPVTALGVSASTEQERVRYANIAYQLKNSRDEKQNAFYKTALHTERLNNPNSNRWKTNNEMKFGFSETLPSNKQSLTSVFLKPADCKADENCIDFVLNLITSNSTYNKTDFYFVKSSPSEISDFVVSLNLDTNKIENGDITLNIEDGEMKSNNLIMNLPFAVRQDNSGQSIFTLDDK